MRLHSLRLQNFRQHADTLVSFELGLTGIIGTNGCGKSTILEGIGFALYGVAATRGKKDSIKWNRGQPRASVRVVLEFGLAGHRYRVVRGLTTAELFVDGAEAPMANSTTGVSDQLQRVLGMTRDEFFNTYFTGQKELNFMAALGPSDRARFLSRVLGFDKLGEAQELIRERKRALVSEATGLRAGMADPEAVSRELEDATARLTTANARLATLRDEQTKAVTELALVEPAWTAMREAATQDQQLGQQIALAEQAVATAAREVERLQSEVKRLDEADAERSALQPQLAALPKCRADLERLTQASQQHAERQQFLGQLAASEDQAHELEAALDDSEAAEMAFSRAHDALQTAAEQESAAIAAARTARDAWKAEQATLTAELAQLRAQHTALKDQRAALQAKGADGVCVTCQQTLGETWQSTIARLSNEITRVFAAGTAIKEQLAGLEQPPAPVVDATRAEQIAAQQVQACAAAFRTAESTVERQRRLRTELQVMQAKCDAIRVALADSDVPYDAAQHQAMRAEVERLQPVETRLAVLNALLKDADHKRRELATAGEHHAQASGALAVAQTTRALLAFNAVEFAALTAGVEQQRQSVRMAGDAVTATQHEVTRAEEARGFALRRQAECAAQRERLTMLELDRQQHEELDRAYTHYRTELNANLRPELAEIASGLLDMLTDGRYAHAEFDEQYVLTVVEDGIAKPVISGGEEDLCNLVLRLAISQMIAERAGHAFSLLILDEVFGALDQTRRNNVLQLLRSLSDRFEQVIVITHFDEMRDALDHIIHVKYDAELGCSAIVTDGEGAASLEAELAVAA